MSDGDALSQANEEWPTRAAETVVGYVDTVRTATSGKALVFSRWAVYGLVLIPLIPIILILVLIASVRAATSIFAATPWFESGEVWPAYLLLGFLCFLVGSILWRKRGS